ncbi:MAG: DUF899 family protein [Acidimicrobiales bacterium]
MVEFASTLGWDLVASQGKSATATRTVDLDGGLVAVLQQQQEMQRFEARRSGHTATEYVFTKPAGEESMKTSEQPYDMPGRTCFLEMDGRVFRTYSQYARGLESTGGSYYFLDLTALGRQEDWEEPAGRSESARGNIPDFAS